MFAMGYSGVRPRPSLQKALLTELQGRSDFDTDSLLLIVYVSLAELIKMYSCLLWYRNA